MKIRFLEPDLERMECELAFVAGLPPPVARAYRGRLQLLRAAPKEQAVRPLRSLEFRVLRGDKHALRITDEWDLVVTFEDSQSGRVAVVEAMVKRKTTRMESPS